MLRAALIWFLAVLALAGGGFGADSPSANGPSGKSPADSREREKARDEQKRLSTEAARLRAAGRIPEAIAAGERAIVLARQLQGDVSAAVGAWWEWLAPLYESRQDWPAARHARQEALALCLKMYGEKGWRATEGRLVLANVEVLARLSPDERRQLVEADQQTRQAAAFVQMKAFDRAISLGEQALEARRHVLGGEHRDTASTSFWLAGIYRSAGKYTRAESSYRQALEIRKKVLGEQHPQTAVALNNLADLYRVMKDNAKAEPLFREAIDACRSGQGENHPNTVACINNLADLYRSGGEFDKALPLYRQALEIRKRTLGDRHPLTAVSLSNLASLYRQRHNDGAAEPLLEAALNIRRKVLKEGDPQTVVNMNELAAVYQSQAEYAKAEPLLRGVFEIRKKSLGENHLQTVLAEDALAALYQVMGDYAKAEALYRQALEIREKVRGPSDLQTAVGLNNLAILYGAMGAFSKAEPLFRQAIEIATKSVGEKHAFTAAYLNNLAMCYSRMGDGAKAEPLCRQALEIRKQVLGPKNRATAANVLTLADIYYNMRDYAKAEPLYQQALAIQKEVLGEGDLDTASTLSHLGELYESMQNFARAEPCYRQALEIQKRVAGERNAGTALEMYRLAMLYKLMGHYAQAEPLCQRSLEIRRSLLGEKHLDTAQSLNALGVLYSTMGDDARAEPFLQRALEIRMANLGESHEDTAQTLSNLAASYEDLGQYEKAEPLYRRVLEISRKLHGDKHQSTARSLSYLAGIYVALGDSAKAEPLLRQALEIDRDVLGEKHRDTAQILNSLGLMYDSMGNLARAEQCFQEAWAIRKAVLGPKHLETTESLHNLASIYQSRGQNEKVEALTRELLEIQRSTLGDNHPQTQLTINNLACLYEAIGNFAKAESLFRENLEIRKKLLGDKNRETVISLRNLGHLYFQLSEFGKAEPILRQALESSLEVLDRNLGGFAERQQFLCEANNQANLNAYLSIAEQAGIGDAAVYGYVLKAKAAVTARQSLMRLARRRPELKAIFQDLESVTTRLSNLALATPDPDHAAARLHDVDQLTEQKELLEQKLAAQSADFAAIREAASESPAQQLEKLKAALPAGHALVDMLEYWRSAPLPGKKNSLIGARHLAAFVVRRDREVKRLDLGPAIDVAGAVENWRKVAVVPDRPRTDGGEFLQKLKTIVWDKLEPHLAGAGTILVSPDGPLCRFPLEVLPGSKPDTYLVEERTIVVVPIPRLLSQLVADVHEKHDQPQPESLLLVGDVEYGGSPGQADQLASRSAPRAQSLHNFRRLDHSAAEVAAIQLSFGRHFKRAPVDLLLGEEATESAFRRQAPGHRWLHLATHGFYDPPEFAAPKTAATSQLERSQPPGQPPAAQSASPFDQGRIGRLNPGLLSGLALAGANCQTVKPGADDGILTALEVSSLDLSGVELAVLSACETGLGSTIGTAGGEGLLGLQRAFQVAGAKSVMAGLWRVPDRETMLLMQRFYQNVWTKKLPKGQALREAQIWMLKEAKPPRGLDTGEEETPAAKKLLPKYWAGFVLSGDWR